MTFLYLIIKSIFENHKNTKHSDTNKQLVYPQNVKETSKFHKSVHIILMRFRRAISLSDVIDALKILMPITFPQPINKENGLSNIRLSPIKFNIFLFRNGENVLFNCYQEKIPQFI